MNKSGTFFREPTKLEKYTRRKMTKTKLFEFDSFAVIL